MTAFRTSSTAAPRTADASPVSRLARYGAVAALAAAALGSTAAAHAGSDVYWSIGVGSPGVVVGATNAPPAVVYPAPRVVYPAPQVVYQQPYPVVVYPQPVYRTGWVPPGHRRDDDRRRDHHRHGGHDRDRDGWDRR